MSKKISADLMVAASQRAMEKEYWIKKLSGELKITTFPVNFKNTTPGVYDIEIEEFEIKDNTFKKIMEIINRSDQRLLVILVSILTILLKKYSGSRDILVGCPVYKQDINQELINHIVVLRNEIKEEMVFKDLLYQVMQTINEAMEHYCYPIDLLAEHLNLNLCQEEDALLDIMILLENIHDKKYLNDRKPGMIFSFIREDESLKGRLSFNPSLYQKTFVQQIIRHFSCILSQVIFNVSQLIEDIEILSEEERRRILVDFNHTDGDFQVNKTIDQYYQEQVLQCPDRIALNFNHQSLTYQALDQFASHVANYITSVKNSNLDGVVGILMERSINCIVGIFGIIKSGNAFVPIEASLPEERIKSIIDDSALSVLISEKKYIRTLNRLQWECRSLKRFLCMDSFDIYSEEEQELNHLMSSEMWDYVASSAADEISGGGWQSSYTGKFFSKEEMDEYQENIELKLTPHIQSEMRILEIGCASGFSMYRLAPKVKFYCGTDISPVIIEKNKERIKREGIKNVQLHCSPAHEIDKLGESEFDLVILNSVVQYFHGHNYLRKVINKIIRLLNHRGHIFIGDVMDQDLKKELIDDLIRFKRSHPDKNYKTKTNWSTELFLSRNFFRDLQVDIPVIQRIEFSSKIHTLENELTKFRYDTLLTVNKTRDKIERRTKQKYQDDLKFLSTFHHTQAFESIRLHHLAYIAYTSGSTGKPKGVPIEQGSLLNTLLVLSEYYPLREKDTILFKTSLAFDVSIVELFVWFFKGGRVVVLENEGERDAGILLETICKCHITHINFVPSLLNALLDAINPDEASQLNSLKTIFLAGEALTSELVKKTRSMNPGILVENIYGPTEAAVYATRYSLQDWDNKSPIPIGKPLVNTLVYILDPWFRPQPLGVPGELYLAGAGIARGYLNQPELTKKNFCLNKKFLRGPGAVFLKSAPGCQRHYRTGDLCRWFFDGNIEFMGRIDQQVKVRGCRIELEEIRNQLLKHEKIEDVAVVAREEKNNDKYICAYIVSKMFEGQTKIDLSELRDYLLLELPDYMVPSYFIIIKSLPLTASGKLEQKALPDPLKEIAGSGAEYQAPSTEIERILVEIWEGVLGRKRIGLQDNFFMIGGDSIKSIQIVARLRKQGYQIKVGDIFLNPFIAKLAPLIQKIGADSDQSVVTGISLLTPIQYEFFQQQKTDHHHYNHAVMLHVHERIPIEMITTIFSKIQEHHDALRSTFLEYEGKMKRENHGLNYPLSIKEYNLQNHENEVLELEKMANGIQTSMNLEEGPLMKLGLFHLAEGDRLLIVIHHLVVDGISWRILLEDIETLFQQYQRGKELKLTLKTDSFNLWTEKLFQYARSDILSQEVEYWRKLSYAGNSMRMKDFANGDNLVKYTQTRSFALSQEETECLLTKVNNAFGTENNDILITALGLAVKDVFKIDQIFIALEGHGREEVIPGINVSRTVGWFTSLFPVQLNMNFANDLRRQIIEIKENLHRIPNKGIGYGVLKYLTPLRHKNDINLDISPPINFNYLGQFDTDINQSMFNIAKESVGKTQSDYLQRDFELYISGMIVKKQLNMTIAYSWKQYNASTIKELMGNYSLQLKRIIQYCSNQSEREFTPCDLTYKGLKIHQLDQFKEKLTAPLEDIYPLSPMQEGMLFHSLLEKKQSLYVEQLSFSLEGELDIEIFKKALHVLFERYDVLRTVFFFEDFDFPLQVVLKEQKAYFDYHDLSGVKNPEKESQIKELKERDRNYRYDLSKDVLMRVTALRKENDLYEIIWSFHHILMDGWCIGILISEFLGIYSCFLERQDYSLPPVKPFKIFIQWLEKQDKFAAKEFWQNYLENYNCPAIIPREDGKTQIEKKYQVETKEIHLDIEMSKTLRKIAGENNISLNVLMQAAWVILLGKYTGKKDMVYGTVVSGRPPEIEGIESMVGLFINTIPVRIQYKSDDMFVDLLKVVQEQTIASEAFQHYPLAKIQALSPIKQDLFEHIVGFDNYPIAHQIDGIQQMKGNANQKSKFNLTNFSYFEITNCDLGFVIGAHDEIIIKCEFNASIYSNKTVEKILKDYQNVFHQLIKDIRLRIKDIHLKSDRLLAKKAKIDIEFDF